MRGHDCGTPADYAGTNATFIGRFHPKRRRCSSAFGQEPPLGISASIAVALRPSDIA
jgi:hypothetical protein